MSCVLIISPEDWGDHPVSKHHYAMALAARGFRVLFLNPPDDALRRPEIRPVEGHPGVSLVSGPRLAPGLRYWPALIRRWVEGRWLAGLEGLAGEPIDIVWLFENSRFFDMGFAGPRLKIYHQVDLNQGFHAATAARTADICFCTTDFIADKLTPFNRRVYKVRHGLARRDEGARLDASQRGHFSSQGVQAVYVGNLAIPYLDEQLLGELPARFPAVHFHFVGGYDNGGALRRITSGLGNITWWGKVDSALIPAILDEADVLLITYRAAEHPMQVASPHKVMEYLASGKTIVATATEEYRGTEHLLEMAGDREEFVRRFGEVIERLDDYNSPELCTRRAAYAQDNRYDRQLERIFEYIAGECPGRISFPAGASAHHPGESRDEQ